MEQNNSYYKAIVVPLGKHWFIMILIFQNYFVL